METSSAVHGSGSPDPDPQVIANISRSVQTLQGQFIKHEMRALKEMMEEGRREMEMERTQVEEGRTAQCP